MLSLPIDEVEALLRSAAAAAQMSEADAAMVASAVVRTQLQKDQRMSPIREFAGDLNLTATRGFPTPLVLNDARSVRSYDLQGAPGLLHMPRISREAVALAADNGVGAVALRNTGGVHTLSAWVLDAAEAGYVTLFCWNGGSYTTVPFGGVDPFFGTNPIAFGIPTIDRPILADMATSEIPFMDLMSAIRDGRALPDGAGLDEVGRPTSDPRKVYDIDADGPVHLRPMGGGYKGSAVVLLLEVLTGALVGARMSREATDDPFTPEEFGGVLLCLDPSAFGSSSDAFRASVTRMRDQIRSSAPASGSTSVVVPGDRAYEREAEARRNGLIEVEAEVVEQLRSFASR